jgi:hypothetical protein
MPERGRQRIGRGTQPAVLERPDKFDLMQSGDKEKLCF